MTGLESVCYSYGVAAVWCEFVQQHIGKASGMGEETIATVLKDVPSQQEFILREKYSCITVLRTYRHWRGTARRGGAGRPCRASQCVVRNLT